MTNNTQREPRGVCFALSAAAGVVAFVLVFVNIGASFLLALILALIAAGLAFALCWQKAPVAIPAKPHMTKPHMAGKAAAQAASGASAEQTSAAPEATGQEPPSDEAPAGPVEASGATDTPAPGADTAVGAGSDESARPEFLAIARDGGPDNLKKIKGVGPKLEDLLHSLGIYHFDQIAAWTPAEIAWVDANLKGFKGRVSRDDWVAQARILAAGGETEFSKRASDRRTPDRSEKQERR